MLGGPLFSLRLRGMLCPCCEGSENKSARLSLRQLNRLGTKISWHTARSNGSKKTSGGFLQSMFGRGSNNNNGGSNAGDAPSPAKLVVRDATKDSINNGEPYPELQICPRKAPADNDDGPLPQQNSAMSFQLDIPLHHIQRIESIDATGVAIYTRDAHAIDEKAAKEPTRISFSSSDDRDAAALDLQVLVEWNKQRRPEGIEEELPAAGIRQRAKNAAHFAKREIEMREKKREREKRKARHLGNIAGGGLKYTAMAMANSSQEVV